MFKKLYKILISLITFLVLTGCDELRYEKTKEFKLELFNNYTNIIGFNDDFYTEHLIIEEQVTFYCNKHKENETRYVSSVEEKAFQNKGLKSVTINSTEKSKFSHIMDYAFADNNDLNSVILPDTILHIGNFAFSNNNGLESIDLHSVKTLGKSVFLNNLKLKYIDLGSDLKSIGENAFKNCHDELVIRVENQTPPTIGNDVFKGVTNLKILVPEELLETYKNAEGWNQYSLNIFIL